MEENSDSVYYEEFERVSTHPGQCQGLNQVSVFLFIASLGFNDTIHWVINLKSQISDMIGKIDLQLL
jgi:hypothetical protein